MIVGAGFGGLQCARKLDGSQVDVTLIDRHNYHVFTPLLYQVASSLLNPAAVIVVLSDDTLVITMQDALSPAEKMPGSLVILLASTATFPRLSSATALTGWRWRPFRRAGRMLSKPGTGSTRR